MSIRLVKLVASSLALSPDPFFYSHFRRLPFFACSLLCATYITASVFVSLAFAAEMLTL
jgi:hypothetical protein